jgi:transcriptional regulator GlxA family with amidase domain
LVGCGKKFRYVGSKTVFKSSGGSAGMNVALGLMAKRLDHAPVADVTRGARHD